MHLTVREIYALYGTEAPDELKSHWCADHDHWGKEGELCPSCDAILQDKAALGIYSPYDEWLAAQKAYVVLELREKADALAKELEEYYELSL
jgi:hypothetical protein